MIINFLLFAAGLGLLVKGGDLFVDGAVAIAQRFKLPELLIGATVVSVGTTLPEVMVSAASALRGHGELAYGNSLGSIICNTALIAALSAAFRPSEIKRKALITPVIFFFAASAVYLYAAYIIGGFLRPIGVILLAVFAVYIVVSVLQTRKKLESESDSGGTIGAEAKNREGKLTKHILLLILGAALITLGAELLVDNGKIIAERIGVPESVIALTFIALGTSLPELVTAVSALIKGHGALSLGNVIGANLLNLALVTGTAATLAPFDVPVGKTLFGINSTLVLDIPTMMLVMLALTLPAIFKGRLLRAQGILLLSVYIAFNVLQFVI